MRRFEPLDRCEECCPGKVLVNICHANQASRTVRSIEAISVLQASTNYVNTQHTCGPSMGIIGRSHLFLVSNAIRGLLHLPHIGISQNVVFSVVDVHLALTSHPHLKFEVYFARHKVNGKAELKGRYVIAERTRNIISLTRPQSKLVKHFSRR